MNSGYEVCDFNFYFLDDKYMAETRLSGKTNKYILDEETKDSYIFRKCIIRSNGRVEIPFGAPRMTIFKDWDKISIEKTFHGDCIILTEEISQSEYDKITQTKDIFPQ